MVLIPKMIVNFHNFTITFLEKYLRKVVCEVFVIHCVDFNYYNIRKRLPPLYGPIHPSPPSNDMPDSMYHVLTHAIWSSREML